MAQQILRQGQHTTTNKPRLQGSASGSALVDAQNILSSGNVINNNFNIINNFVGLPGG